MNTDELSRQLHRSAVAVHLHEIDTDAVIDKAGRVRFRRRVLACCAAGVVLAAGAAIGLVLAADRHHVATISPQPLPTPSSQSTPSPVATATPTPSRSLVPTVTTSTLPPTTSALPAGWSAAGGVSDLVALSRAAVGDKIVYWAGENGQDAAHGYSSRGHVFDVARRIWTDTSPSPLEGRYGAATAGSDRLFFVWGGDQEPPELTAEQRATMTQEEASARPPKGDGATYDVVTRSWRVLPPAPLPAGPPLGAAWDGSKFLVIGNGRSAAYDPSTNRWEQLPRLPTPPGTAAVAQVGDRTYVVGAYSYFLTAGDSAWTAIPSVQNALLSTLTAASDGTTLFAAALTGSRAGPVTAPLIVDRFDPVTATWIALPPSPAKEAECLVPLAVTPHSVFVACATSSVYDRVTGTWRDYGVAASWGGTGPSVVGGNDPIAVGSAIVFGGSTTLIYSR